MSEKGPKHRVRLGYAVFGVLVVSKIVEYVLVMTVHSGAWSYLAVLALFGAWLICYYFMHVHALWREKGR